MRLEAKKYLFDMHQAAELIRGFTASRTRQEYLTDVLLSSAVERQFQILGEALFQLDRRFPKVAARVAA